MKLKENSLGKMQYCGNNLDFVHLLNKSSRPQNVVIKKNKSKILHFFLYSSAISYSYFFFFSADTDKASRVACWE